jgi:hypothetical protein
MPAAWEHLGLVPPQRAGFEAGSVSPTLWTDPPR